MLGEGVLYKLDKGWERTELASFQFDSKKGNGVCLKMGVMLVVLKADSDHGYLTGFLN